MFLQIYIDNRHFQSAESDFNPAYVFILTVKTLAYIIHSILAVFIFVEDPKSNLI